MNPKKINTYHANTSDVIGNEAGKYFPYNNLPKEVGDLVILEIYPEFDDIMEQFKYIDEDKYPPDYLVLAKVTRFEDAGFFCEVLMEESRSSDTKVKNTEFETKGDKNES